MKSLSSLSAALIVLLPTALMLTAGCGGDSDAGVSVSGKVLFEGQPLSNTALMFYPADGRAVTAPVTDGEYAAELPPGEYKVTITLGAELPPGWKEGDPVPPSTRELPPQFSSRLDTPLAASVTAGPGESQTIDFTVP